MRAASMIIISVMIAIGSVLLWAPAALLQQTVTATIRNIFTTISSDVLIGTAIIRVIPIPV
eukprot:11706686-Alexandrium_andersonii.AAC.1